MRKLILLSIIFLNILSSQGFATTIFYVDPDATSSNLGTQSNPFTSIPDAFSAANSANDNVVIYFSSRDDSGTANQLYQPSGSTTINWTDTTHTLVLDGISYWNPSDTSPPSTWNVNDTGPWTLDSAYNAFKFEIKPTGGSSCMTTGYTTKTDTASHPRYNITLRGFKLNAYTGQILIVREFDNGNIVYNEMLHQSTATGGPGLNLVTNYAAASGAGSLNSKNVYIGHNVVHDTFGEAIYVAGCYEYSSCSDGNHNVTVEDNRIYDGGRWGNGGDLVDVKNGNVGTVISHNDMYFTIWLSGKDQMCITTHAPLIADGNFCRGYPTKNFQGGIAFRDGGSGWNYDFAPLTSPSKIINNLIIDVGNGAGDNAGIYITSDGAAYDWENILVANNTVIGAEGPGIEVSQYNTNITIENNVVKNNGSPQISIASGITGLDDDYNLIKCSSGNAISRAGVTVSCTGDVSTVEPHSINNQDPNFVDETTTPYEIINFDLNSGSPAIGTGLNLYSSFTNDILGNSRLNSGVWTIGAIKHLSFSYSHRMGCGRGSHR